MKILALFFLSGFLLFFPATGVVPLYAQHYHGTIPDSYQQLQSYDSAGIKSDEQHAIENLEISIIDLNKKLQLLEIANQTREAEISNLEYDLKEAKAEADAAHARIDVLEQRGAAWDRLFAAESAQQMLRYPPSKPKATASKPKAPVNQTKPAVKEGTH